MKEYEYIVIAIEEFLCDNISAIVCLENYNNCQFVHGFRNFFYRYRQLHKTYQEKAELFKSKDYEKEKQRYLDECKQNRNEMLEAFIKDTECYLNIDFKSIVDSYYSELEKEDVITPDKRIYIHKHIISSISKNSKKKEGERDGNEV